jgi:hypothetical protein
MIRLKTMLVGSKKDNRNLPPAFVNNCPDNFRIKSIFIGWQVAFSSDEKETAEFSVKSAPPIFFQLVAVNDDGFLLTLPNNLFYQTVTTKENEPHRRDHQRDILKTKCRRCLDAASAAWLRRWRQAQASGVVNTGKRVSKSMTSPATHCQCESFISNMVLALYLTRVTR